MIILHKVLKRIGFTAHTLIYYIILLWPYTHIVTYLEGLVPSVNKKVTFSVSYEKRITSLSSNLATFHTNVIFDQTQI